MSSYEKRHKKIRILMAALCASGVIAAASATYILMNPAQTMTKDGIEEMDPNEDFVVSDGDTVMEDAIPAENLVQPEENYDDVPLIEEWNDSDAAPADAISAGDTPEAISGEGMPENGVAAVVTEETEETEEAEPASETTSEEAALSEPETQAQPVAAEPETVAAQVQPEEAAEPETVAAQVQLEEAAEPETVAAVVQPEETAEPETVAVQVQPEEAEEPAADAEQTAAVNEIVGTSEPAEQPKESEIIETEETKEEPAETEETMTETAESESAEAETSETEMADPAESEAVETEEPGTETVETEEAETETVETDIAGTEAVETEESQAEESETETVETEESATEATEIREKTKDEVYVETEGELLNEDWIDKVGLEVRTEDGWEPVQTKGGETISVDADQMLRFRVTYTVEPGTLSPEMRTLIYKIPGEITSVEESYGEIVDADENVIADYAIDTSGLIHVTFTEEIAELNAAGTKVTCAIEFRTKASNLIG